MRVRVGMSWAWMMVEREVVRARRKWWSFMIILNCGPFFVVFCSWAGPGSGFGDRFLLGRFKNESSNGGSEESCIVYIDRTANKGVKWE